MTPGNWGGAALMVLGAGASASYVTYVNNLEGVFDASYVQRHGATPEMIAELEGRGRQQAGLMR